MLAPTPSISSGQIALEGFGTKWQKERAFTSPNRQERRLVGAAIGVKLRIDGNIGLVVTQQVELDVIGPRAIQVV